MSADPTILINANTGNLGKILMTPDASIWHARGFNTTNIFAVDNGSKSTPLGTAATFGGEDHFQFRKRGGRVHRTWLRIEISAATLAGGITAAYVDDMANNIIENLRIEYASKTIQEYNGEFLKAYNRLQYHDISREQYNALAFAGLPPGGPGETARSGNLTSGVLLYVPLDWLWFTRSEDYALTPEALASNLDLVVQYAPLERLVYARTGGGVPPVVSPFTVAPRIVKAELCHQLVFTPYVEKAQHLSTFESRQGQIFKILDVEEQLNNPIEAAANTYKVDLNNFRLDSQFLVFYLRDNRYKTPWTLDKTMSDPTATLLTGGGSVAALQPITSFKVYANGSTIVDICTDIENRALWRYHYFPGGQISDYVYFVPWSWLLRDCKNVSGFQNMANLGNVQLEITVGARANTSSLDVYNVCHNVIQNKKGDIIKALR